jgi:penicillin-binding protein 1B
MSQLNRALAKRQPGSIFKPFVYAAALSTGLYDAREVFTTTSILTDEPTVFATSNGVPYEPGNFHDKYFGQVTLRKALLYSLNIPTVKLAQAVGYGRVVELARRAGLKDQRSTPSVALGSYEATPIDMAGAYTTFVNGGRYIKPTWIQMIRDDRGAEVFTSKPETNAVLDARVNYLMVNLMEDVMRSGTGAGARSRGFWQTAAGKTGTSRDGWFAGFTSKLICVVWVGFDDNKDLKLEGAKTALPVWTEFMKRAHQRARYRNVVGFGAPDGIINADVDVASGKLGSPGDEGVRTEVFIAGTEPVEVGGGKTTQVAGWDAAKPADEVVKADAKSTAEIEAATRQVKRETKVVQAASVKPTEVKPKPADPVETAVRKEASADKRKKGEKKAGFWGRVRDIFK